jgi:cysteine-rich repeat protein
VTAPGHAADWLPAARRSIAAREYEASPAAGGLQAPNRAHSLRTWFEPTGIRVHDRSAAGAPRLAELRMAGFGRSGAPLAALAPGAVSSAGTRVEIRRPGLVEWYVNGPAGLEQGFTLEARPPGEGALQLELHVAHAKAKQRGDSVVLASHAGRRLDYGHLAVRDAMGSALPARLETPAESRVRITVEDAGAAYPIVIDPLLTAASDTVLRSSQGGATFGHVVAGAGDVNGDGFADVVVGDPFYDSGELDEGAAFVFLGGAGGIADGDPASAATRLQSDQQDSRFGWSVAGAGDVNGDGFADVVVGAPQFVADVVDDEGAAFVFLGSAAGVADGTPATAAAQLESDQEDSFFGGSVDGAGDVDGDGFADVVVGANAYASGEDGEGAVFVFRGSAAGIADGSPASAFAQLERDEPDAFLGSSVAGAGDVDGDGLGDVIAGAPGYEGEGRAFVFVDLATGVPANVAFVGNGSPGDQYGASVDGAGDVDGDGYADVVVGSPAAGGGAGEAWVFYGPDLANSSDSDRIQISSDQATAMLGTSVAGAGDVNGDGLADVIVGAPRYDSDGDGEKQGSAFVFLGRTSQHRDREETPADATAQVADDAEDSWLGFSVAGAGDVDGDGFADVMVGAFSYVFSSGASPEGAAFVYRGGGLGVLDGGPETAGVRLAGDTADASFAQTAAAAGDVDGDGFGDVMIGAPDFDTGQGIGAVFVFHGDVSIGNLVPSQAATRLEADDPGVGSFGYSLASAGDVNGDGYGDVIVGAPYGGGSEGLAFVFHGSPAGIPGGGATATAAARIAGDQADSHLGESVAGAGDVNGDGFADVAVGARRYDAGEDNEGLALVYLGGAAGIGEGDPSTADTRLEGNQESAFFGASVASAGDVNGDGFADVVVAANRYDAGQPLEGAAFVFHGGAGGIADGGPSTAATRFETDVMASGLDVASGAGDVNGDGFGDVIVASPARAVIFLGEAGGIPNSGFAAAATELLPSPPYTVGGREVAGAGDLNGDGFADVIVGVPDDRTGEREGAAFVFLGSALGIPDGGQAESAALLTVEVPGTGAVPRFGDAVAGVGDLNGDGFADLIVGAPGYDVALEDEGAAFLFYGNRGEVGREVRARQRRGDGSNLPVQPWGGSSATGFLVASSASHPEGSGRVRLEVEACPPSAPFGAPACTGALGGSFVAVGGATPEVGLVASLAGLDPETLYRWRARVLHAPATGPLPASPAHGPWRRVGAQVVEADLRTGSDPVVPICGDGNVDAGEECDDGNTASGDGCDASCVDEPGGICGDGTVDAGEECDDGNLAGGDGCDAQCRTESACPAAPAPGCIAAAKASLSVDERKGGKEKLAAKLSGFDAATAQADFGDPVAGDARYDLCVYDAEGALAAGLAVDRAGARCGAKQKPCWKAVKAKGWRYKDPDASADGVRSFAASTGSVGKGKLDLKAGNAARKGKLAFETGVTARLEGDASATLQLHARGAECFSAALGVKKAEAALFKARTP